MKMIKTKYIRFAIIFILCFNASLIKVTSYAEEGQYPMKVEIIDKDQARYDTPENAYAAMISSLVKKDLAWYYETLTEGSAERDKKEFQESGIDPKKNFDLVIGIKEDFIIDKIVYKTGVMLICKSYEESGVIMKGPSIFVKEDGKWKHTDEYSSDEILLDYMDYVPSLFDGKGQRPADANTFLAYATPQQMRTELPAGSSKFSLHIFYGETIDPATFKTELNRDDISSRFDPKPVGDQVVELDLIAGRNVLLLSVEGKREDGRKAKDSDRLVFIVP